MRLRKFVKRSDIGTVVLPFIGEVRAGQVLVGGSELARFVPTYLVEVSDPTPPQLSVTMPLKPLNEVPAPPDRPPLHEVPAGSDLPELDDRQPPAPVLEEPPPRPVLVEDHTEKPRRRRRGQG